MKTIETRHTAACGIQICRVDRACWRHIDTNDGAHRPVGPNYHSKAELLQNHTFYLLQAGWLRLTIPMPKPQFEVSRDSSSYCWSMDDDEVGVKVYGNTARIAIDNFVEHIAFEFGGRLTIENFETADPVHQQHELQIQKTNGSEYRVVAKTTY